ncbi:MAG: DUF5752 family protein [Thermodesulfobacteriota bacterium]
MTSKTENIQPLKIKDCAMLKIATGIRAQNIQELRDAIITIHPGSIFYHFWNRKLRPAFEKPEYYNDFAMWAYNSLHDNKLTERLGLINPLGYDAEDIRKKLIEVLDSHIEENQSYQNSKEGEQFQFTRSEIVVFDTDIVINKPNELPNVFGELSLGSIYYHYIYTNLPSENIYQWLGQNDHKALTIEIIDNLDCYFLTLEEIRSRSAQIFTDFFKGESN